MKLIIKIVNNNIQILRIKMKMIMILKISKVLIKIIYCKTLDKLMMDYFHF